MATRHRWLLGLLLLMVLAPLRPAGAGKIPGVPSVESGEWILRLVRFERSGAEFGEYAFTFDAQNRKGGKRTTLQLRNETTDIDRIEVSGSTLVIFGNVGSSADIVNLFDLNSGQKLDSFLCWWPRMSATGRYIAAVRFFPRFSDPSLTSHAVVLYDLQGPRGARSTDEKKPPLRVVFPEDGGEAPVEKEAERHSIDAKAGFLWSPADDRLAFVDRHRGDSWLVVVELTDGQARIRRFQLDVASVLALPKDDPGYAETLRRERAGLAIERLRWEGEGVVVVELDRKRWAAEGLYRVSELRVNIGAEK